jgi:uncharacterized membrane protein (UPF0127 family)
MSMPELNYFMPDRYWIVIFIVLLLLKVEAVIPGDVSFEKEKLMLGGEEYLLEIARSTYQRNRGLMNRDQLKRRHGMLFIYPRPGYHRIWMKNTRIALTVIWIDVNGEIIGVKNLLPCTSDPCPSYGVSKPSKYVLELSEGDHHLKSGSRISGLVQLE